jgi:hypothetical protein
VHIGPACRLQNDKIDSAGALWQLLASLRYARLAQTRQITLKVLGILDEEESIAREAAREIGLAVSEFRKRRRKLRLPP